MAALAGEVQREVAARGDAFTLCARFQESPRDLRVTSHAGRCQRARTNRIVPPLIRVCSSSKEALDRGQIAAVRRTRLCLPPRSRYLAGHFVHDAGPNAWVHARAAGTTIT